MAPADKLLNVEVVYCPRPGVTDLVVLRLAPGATVDEALRASGIVQRHSLAPGSLHLGVWGRPRDAASPLRDRDRVEVYRALAVDPKEARRLRYKRHRGAVAKV
jgi:putative ubiquitin-RnfH superfamily antitoxin RatB of RatAB toxin-antitoxin module